MTETPVVNMKRKYTFTWGMNLDELLWSDLDDSFALCTSGDAERAHQKF